MLSSQKQDNLSLYLLLFAIHISTYSNVIRPSFWTDGVHPVVRRMWHAY